MPAVSDVCTVLSHELRTPLTVLQGYLRLIQRTPAPAAEAHVTAMLDATAQIAAIGRQASELAAWLRDDRAASLTRVPIQSFLAGLASAATSHQNVIVLTDVPAAVATSHLRLDPRSRELDRAIVTIAAAVARDVEAPRATVRVAGGHEAGASVVALVTPENADARIVDARETSGDRPWYLSGGFGLSLVAASLICEAYEARVTWGAPGRPTLIHLPADQS